MWMDDTAGKVARVAGPWGPGDQKKGVKDNKGPQLGGGWE